MWLFLFLLCYWLWLSLWKIQFSLMIKESNSADACFYLLNSPINLLVPTPSIPLEEISQPIIICGRAKRFISQIPSKIGYFGYVIFDLSFFPGNKYYIDFIQVSFEEISIVSLYTLNPFMIMKTSPINIGNPVLVNIIN